MSFGFKHGPPRDEDLAFDVRFLPNPHYEPELRELTGLDEAVVEFIARDGRLEELYERLHPLLDFLLPQYVAEGKAHLVIAIGCTGGRHRSVAIAEHLAERYRDERRPRSRRRAPRHRQALRAARERDARGPSATRRRSIRAALALAMAMPRAGRESEHRGCAHGRADSLRPAPGEGAALPRPGIVHFRFRRTECPYALGSTDSAASAGTCSAPRRPGAGDRREIEWVAVNDLTDAATLAHLLKYDSILGPYPGTVCRSATDALDVDGRELKVLAERDPGGAALGRSRRRRGDRVDRAVHRPRRAPPSTSPAGPRRSSSRRRRPTRTRPSCWASTSTRSTTATSTT